MSRFTFIVIVLSQLFASILIALSNDYEEIALGQTLQSTHCVCVPEAYYECDGGTETQSIAALPHNFWMT